MAGACRDQTRIENASRPASLSLLKTTLFPAGEVSTPAAPPCRDAAVRSRHPPSRQSSKAAASAGLQVAQGDAVALIDADLQDPPEILLEMIDRWRAGVDVAYGQRRKREGETFFKLVTARLFYRLLAGIAERPVPLDTGDFRLMDRTVADCIVNMPEQDRFLRGMVAWVGFRQEAVLYDRAPRLAGETKYPFRKMLRLAVDAFVSLSLAPVRVLWWLTGLTAAAAAAAWTTAAVLALVSAPAAATVAIVATILTVGGVNACGLTIVGEYAARVYRQVRGRPLWIVRRTTGRETQAFPQVHRSPRAA
jgi:dolichol-phosphate mannosyltransferase